MLPWHRIYGSQWITSPASSGCRPEHRDACSTPAARQTPASRGLLNQVSILSRACKLNLGVYNLPWGERAWQPWCKKVAQRQIGFHTGMTDPAPLPPDRLPTTQVAPYIPSCQATEPCTHADRLCAQMLRREEEVSNSCRHYSSAFALSSLSAAVIPTPP